MWLLGLPYSVSIGLYIGWVATLEVNLEPLDVPQVQVKLLMLAKGTKLLGKYN